MRLIPTTTLNEPLLSYAPNGDVLIPPEWTGFYSSKPFQAKNFNDGILLTTWLDRQVSVPLQAHCTDAAGFLDTATTIDISLAAVAGKNLAAAGVDLSHHLLGIGHLISVLETAASCDLQTHLPQTVAKKTASTYKRLAKSLRRILNTTSSFPPHTLIQKSNLVRAH